jgi:hypothetical protein
MFSNAGIFNIISTTRVMPLPLVDCALINSLVVRRPLDTSIGEHGNMTKISVQYSLFYPKKYFLKDN